jgi:uncharacterized protein (DUF305 family)
MKCCVTRLRTRERVTRVSLNMKFPNRAAAAITAFVVLTTGCAGWAVGQQTDHVPADVEFMRNMIAHHEQALAMTAMVATRSRREDIAVLALRIELSQDSEIELMRNWLKARDEPESAGTHDHSQMPGMLSVEEMARLAALRGDEFDRTFLQLMIRHHEGALLMLEQLYAQRGGGENPEVFQIASHIDSDQRAEIARMRKMLMEPIPLQEPNETE